MTRRLSHFIFCITGAALLLIPNLAAACAACYGKSDSKLAEGMNWGIFTLLVVVGGVLAGFAAFFIYLAKRSAMVSAQTTEPLAEATQNLS